ncbi:hypothetical protein KFL_003590130 [Klebsormidium nitens]|uniref:ODAD1 central coiled coil region domain-containing protein n=1 Tax=Klebsormidium nitens TaxID=105231 RepID=A0A1Y1IDM8_KLENI|nr:hypothetical protein KFL_003590130 [Klebsormidium nitens]|eukprot:GAQ87539.1 hypothetical protein KFL_003590130 [Klebsormidium nitens]
MAAEGALSTPGSPGGLESPSMMLRKVSVNTPKGSKSPEAISPTPSKARMLPGEGRPKSQLAKEDSHQQENRFTSTAATHSATAQIAKLQDQADMFTRKIELEKRRVAELDKQIQQMNAKIMEQRKKMGGVNAAKENNAQISKQIKILENRLDKALVKYNEAVAHNKALRENIDNLRRERLVFDQIYKKLERELQEKKREMAHIIEISNLAYESRDAAVNEMAALKAQADKEQAAFEAEWKELGKLIEHDRRMKDMMKSREKTAPPEPEKKGDMSVEEEQKLKKKVIRGNWNIAKDKVAQAVSLEKVQSYGEAFAKIQEATGITDIDELVTTFINAEDQNFSLFNYVNELNQEIEKLEEQIADIKAEIEKYKGQGVNTDNQRKKILKELEDRLVRTEAKAEVYEGKHAVAQKTMNALKVGIQNIFTKIGCATPAVKELLGDAGVTESNMMQYLGIIEQRTNEILQLYAASQSGGHGGGGLDGVLGTIGSILGQGPQTPAGATTIAIEPPSTTDDMQTESESDEEEMEERPMTRDELRVKTLKSLGKREGQAKSYAATRFRKPETTGRASAMRKAPPAAAEDT